MSKLRTASQKTSYHHGNLSRALVESALSIAEKEGLKAITLRKLASATGVSVAALYHHFPGRQAFLESIASEGFHLLHGYMSHAFQENSDESLRCLQEIGVAYVLFAISHPGHFRLMFSMELQSIWLGPELKNVMMKTYGVLQKAVDACQRDGWVRAEDVQRTTRAAWSLVHGLAILEIDGQMDPESKSLIALTNIARETTGLFVNGLRGVATGSPRRRSLRGTKRPGRRQPGHR